MAIDVITITCKNCGKEKTIKRCVYNGCIRDGQVNFFCNHKCLGKHRSLAARWITIYCKRCGKARKIREALYVSRTEGGQRNFYCSNKCLGKDRTLGEKGPWYCEKCGKNLKAIGRFCKEHKYENYRKRDEPPEEREWIERECLNCGEKFVAEGRFNRICPRCHKTRKSVDGMGDYMPMYSVQSGYVST